MWKGKQRWVPNLAFKILKSCQDGSIMHISLCAFHQLMSEVFGHKLNQFFWITCSLCIYLIQLYVKRLNCREKLYQPGGNRQILPLIRGIPMRPPCISIITLIIFWQEVQCVSFSLFLFHHVVNIWLPLVLSLSNRRHQFIFQFC